MKFMDWAEIFWGVMLILLAFKFFPVIGLLGALTFGMAGIRIAVLPLDRRVNA